jgi:uncharacterized protein YjbI with pentapeptide repeats
VARRGTCGDEEPGGARAGGGAMIEIKHKDTGEVLKRVDDETLTFTDLAGAHLRGADLAFVDLQWVSLIDADLRGADLYGADLCGARLLYADLGEADLRYANLRQADFSHVNMRQAKLRGARYDERTVWFTQTSLGLSRGHLQVAASW